MQDDLIAEVLVRLSRRGITPDVQELLVYGNPGRVAPKALHGALEPLADRITALEAGLRKIQGVLDGCKNVPNPGPCGMTLEAQQRHSTYLRVPGEIMLYVEEALYDAGPSRALLKERKGSVV